MGEGLPMKIKRVACILLLGVLAGGAVQNSKANTARGLQSPIGASELIFRYPLRGV